MSKKAPEKTLSIETRIYPVQDHGKLLARATVTLGGCFAVTGLQILEGKEDQSFVSMPSWKVGEKYKDNLRDRNGTEEARGFQLEHSILSRRLLN